MDTMIRRLRATARRRDESEHEWRSAIRDAHAAGMTLRAIAKNAGISHPRVYQIVNEPERELAAH